MPQSTKSDKLLNSILKEIGSFTLSLYKPPYIPLPTMRDSNINENKPLPKEQVYRNLKSLETNNFLWTGQKQYLLIPNTKPVSNINFTISIIQLFLSLRSQ